MAELTSYSVLQYQLQSGSLQPESLVTDDKLHLLCRWLPWQTFQCPVLPVCVWEEQIEELTRRNLLKNVYEKLLSHVSSSLSLTHLWLDFT